MNIFLWILQGLLALHTAVGAVWKFRHSEAQTMPSLKAIGPGIWMTMGGLEILCSLALIIPALHKPMGSVTPIAALVIAAEMLLFIGLHFSAGNKEFGPVIYWLVVAAVCGLIAYGRFVVQPLVNQG